MMSRCWRSQEIELGRGPPHARVLLLLFTQSYTSNIYPISPWPIGLARRGRRHWVLTPLDPHNTS